MSKPLLVCVVALSAWGCTHHSARPTTPVAVAEAAPERPAPLAEPADDADVTELERRDNEWALAQARANGCVALPR